MKVKELVKKFEEKLKPFEDIDVNDWSTIDDALLEVFEDTDICIKRCWDYDD